MKPDIATHAVTLKLGSSKILGVFSRIRTRAGLVEQGATGNRRGSGCPVRPPAVGAGASCALSVRAGLSAGTGELLGEDYDPAVPAVFHTVVAAARIVGVPSAGNTFIRIGITHLISTSAVGVFSALHTPAEGGVAARCRGAAVRVTGTGSTDTSDTECGKGCKLTPTTAIGAYWGSIGACLVGE